MRAFLIRLPGMPVFTVHAVDRNTARSYALESNGYTPAGPAPRFITVIPV